MEDPKHVPYSADPRARWLEIIEAPRRARRRRLSRDGIPAGGVTQLPGPARLEPWRPGDIHHGRDDRGIRPVWRGALRRPLRFRQAGEPQRALYPPCRRSIPRDDVRGDAGSCTWWE